MCRNVPKRCVVSGVLVSSVLVLYIGFGQRVPRWWPSLPLHLPTAAWGACLRLRFQRITCRGVLACPRALSCAEMYGTLSPSASISRNLSMTHAGGAADATIASRREWLQPHVVTHVPRAHPGLDDTVSRCATGGCRPAAPQTPTPHMGEHCAAEVSACTHSFVTLKQLYPQNNIWILNRTVERSDAPRSVYARPGTRNGG